MTALITWFFPVSQSLFGLFQTVFAIYESLVRRSPCLASAFTPPIEGAEVVAPAASYLKVFPVRVPVKVGLHCPRVGVLTHHHKATFVSCPLHPLTIADHLKI